MFVKAGWGLAGGVLLLLTIFGQRVFPVGGSTAAGIGVLYGARGIGAALGPDRAALDSRTDAAHAPTSDRPGVLHGRRVLRGAGAGARRCRSRPLCVLLRALRRIDPVGVQHRAAADGSARSLSRPRVRRRARARHADVVDVQLLDRVRSSTTPAGRRARWPLPSARCSACPERFGSIIESRWKEAEIVTVPAVASTAQEDVLEDRIR